MATAEPRPNGSARAAAVFPADQLASLLAALGRRGYRVIGPLVRDGAIALDEIGSPADLARGWTDRQEAGGYRLERDARSLFFGHTVGPHSWKRFLFPARLRLWRARRAGPAFEVMDETEAPPRLAFLGVRACDLHAIAVQDRVFLDGPVADADYAARRRRAFIVAANCGQAAATCFCTSMGTGPRATSGFDLALTEIGGPDGHRFLAEAGSEQGLAVLGELPTRPAGVADEEAAEAVVAAAASQVRRAMVPGAETALRERPEHPRWQEVAGRCLACTNCTLVCPTCFCWALEDTTDLAGETAERSRRWDSCFSARHSYVHGGSVRASTAARYRQWLTHKLSTWHDQFGSSGCVGCGRCIAWCPAAIDITEEAAAIAGSGAGGGAPC